MRHRLPNIRSGFTLVEMLTALAIMSVLSVAVTSILMGAARTDLYVNQESAAVQEAENAFRRIMHNLRTASAITAPTTVGSSNTLTVVTQPDSANGNATYSVTYALSGGTLTESDSRYNVGATPSTLARNVSAFQVTRNAIVSPQTVTVTIIIGSKPTVSRSVTIHCRNL
jgi:prepilin-type N-terminal cleavage/methylation domain-containing protein